MKTAWLHKSLATLINMLNTQQGSWYFMVKSATYVDIVIQRYCIKTGVILNTAIGECEFTRADHPIYSPDMLCDYFIVRNLNGYWSFSVDKLQVIFKKSKFLIFLKGYNV